MLRLKIKNILIQQIGDDEIPTEVGVKDVTIDLEGNELKFYGEIMKKIERKLKEKESMEEENLGKENGNDESNQINEGKENPEKENGSNEGNQINEENITKKDERIKCSKGYEKLRMDLSKERLEEDLGEENEEIMEIDSTMTIEEMYKEVTNNGKKRKREDVGEWYDVGKKFKRDIEEIVNDEGIKDTKARSKVYEKLMEKKDVESEEKDEKKRKTSIRNKVQRAEKIFKLFRGIGGKRRIRRINCTVDEIGRCKNMEIDNLIEEFR